MNLGMSSGPSSGRARVLDDLSTLSSYGVNTVRILAASEGSQYGQQPDRMYPALMTSPGTYDMDVLEGLDWFLAQLPRFNVTAVVSLSNYWTWSGGIAQYVSWATETRIPYPVQWDHLRQVFAGGEYQAYLDYTNMFYADPLVYNTTQMWFKDHIRQVIGRTNVYTGVEYRNDPSILAWELMNEPQIIPDDYDQLFRWINETASFIHSLDARHLVTTGAESKNGQQWFHAMHRSPYISLASAHFWPLNWGLYNSTDPSLGSVGFAIHEMRKFVEGVSEWSQDLDMPCVLFEYGLMRDQWGSSAGLGAYTPGAPVTHRNRFYAAVADAVVENGACRGEGAFAGAAFWAYAGSARPPVLPTEQLSWTGDPPHEPPGWNSVYNNDTETLSVIGSFSERLGSCQLVY
ncbi:hypothetical protein GGI19_001933 [Coemansia pectinata]|uniref:mannan endo-1,4-beta-mannosidase n=1 Tax=Coemansia pectinata TaxID=1052879 RepID=A0A9W8H0N9_9FUNG|nr:hypothetical protein GGI19_001933 [Coemansia pectinata]